jgi:Mg2+/Co2+ transporter CorB
MDSLLLFAPVALLLLISAYFSCSETALTAFSQPRMFELERQGNRRAAILNRMRARKERMIGSLLVGNNVVNTANSALMTAMFIGWFGEAGLLYATAVASLLIIVFAEILPKTYALYAPDRTALILGPSMSGFAAVLTPVTAAVEAVVVGAFRLFGVRIPRGAAPIASEEELRGVISMRHGPEPEVADERKMLFNVLDLADVSIKRIMTHRGATSMVDGDKSAADVIREVLARPTTSWASSRPRTCCSPCSARAAIPT